MEETAPDAPKDEQEPCPEAGDADQPGEAPSVTVKTESSEEAAEDVPSKANAEASSEAVAEGTLKVEKEGVGSGAKAPVPKASGAPQDSDSSATCSADEVDEPEGGDKNRLLSPRPSLLTPAGDTRASASPQKPLDLKQLKQRAAAIPPIVSAPGIYPHIVSASGDRPVSTVCPSHGTWI